VVARDCLYQVMKGPGNHERLKLNLILSLVLEDVVLEVIYSGSGAVCTKVSQVWLMIGSLGVQRY